MMISRISDLMLSVVLGKNLYNNRPKIWGTSTSVYENAMEVYKRKHEKPDVLLSKESLKCPVCPELRFLKDIGGYKKVWEDGGMNSILLFNDFVFVVKAVLKCG